LRTRSRASSPSNPHSAIFTPQSDWPDPWFDSSLRSSRFGGHHAEARRSRGARLRAPGDWRSVRITP